MNRMPHGTASGASSRGWISALVLLLVSVAPLRADVVVKQQTVSKGLGGFGDGTTTTTLTIAGDRSRTDDEFVYQGPLKTLAGKKPKTSVSIVRLDREVVWDVEPADKRYTEMTFAEMRALVASAGAEMEKARAEARAAEPEAGEQPEMEYTVDVRRTGAKQTIAGFACEQTVVTLTAKPRADAAAGGKQAKDEEAAAAGSGFKMTSDLWLSKAVPGGAELEGFNRRFAEKLGMDPQFKKTAQAAQAMYGDALKTMAEKMKGIEGYPVRSVVTIESAASEEQKAGMAKARADAQKERARDKDARGRAEKAEDAADAAELGTSAASGQDVKGALGGFLAKKMARAASKQAEAKAEKTADAMTASAGGPLFQATTEVVSVTTAAAAPGAFEVPAGYKKVAREK
jgi:hypothetical protein